MVKKCPKCNSNIKDTAKFCENCGYKFTVQTKKDFDIFTDDISQLSKKQLKKEIKKTRKTNIGLGAVSGKFIAGIIILIIIIMMAILFYNMSI